MNLPDQLSEQSDEEIVKQVQRGDVEPFGVIVDRYEPKLLRYAKRFFFDREDTRDLIQEVFVKTYTNLQSFDTSRKFSSWIYRIAHNEFVNAIKKKKGRETVSLFDADILFPHPMARETADSGARTQETRRLLDASLSQISPKYREPLVLYYFEDLDYKEIAEILQIPVSTVGVRLQRGKAMVRKIVEPLQ